MGGNGNTTRTIVCEDKRSLFDEQLKRGLATMGRFNVTTTCVTKDGKKPVCNILAKPQKWESLRWTVIISINACSENYIRSEHLDNVSHEIRTPLHGIRGMIDALSQTDLNVHQADCLKYLR